ncbi:MAG: hypothetical protein K6T92_09405 [Candidatus Rokubacteria bacterium]|nr:hypothetical protein [Candidatus Rokubacteria bacterium]
MIIESRLTDFPPARLRAILADLPPARGYRLVVKPLRYRTRPHLQALCDYDRRTITVQVPEPFRPWVDRIPYRAQRLRGRAARGRPFAFRWFYRTVRFRTKTEVIRFLYCHEYYHHYLHDVLGRKGAAETACDRFALQHFRKRGRPTVRGGASAAPSPRPDAGRRTLRRPRRPSGARAR